MKVSELIRLLGELDGDMPVYAHITADSGWACVPVLPQVGRAYDPAEGAFALLAVNLPDTLEEYEEDEQAQN